MRLKLIWLLYATLISTVLKAQPVVQWQKSLGGTSDEFCWWVITTTDGGFAISARSRSVDGDVTGNHGRTDYWIVKTDFSGNIEWEKSIGGSLSDASNNIIQTLDNGFLIGGFSYSNDGDFHNHHGSDTTSDISIVRLDSMGNILWTQSYGGTNWDIGSSLQALDDGCFLVCAHTNSSDGDVFGYHPGPDPFSHDIWLFKIDSMGNMIWQKCLGGSGEERFAGAFQTPDHGYLVYGDVFGTTDGDLIGNVDTGASAQSAWVVKLDSSLNIQWSKLYGGSGKEEINKVIPQSDGGYLLGCVTESNDGDVSGNHVVGERDYWLVRTDSVGNILWQHCYGGEYYDELNDMAMDVDGGIVMAGQTLTSENGDVSLNYGMVDLWVVKTDSAGNLMWEDCYGGSLTEFCGQICLTQDSGYIISGYSQSNDGDVSGHHGLTTTNDVWLLKLKMTYTGISDMEFPFSSFGAYPSPASDYLIFSLYLETSSDVAISLYDLSGHEVAIVSNRKLPAGHHNLRWEMQDLPREFPDGIYIARIKSGNFTSAGKVSIMR